MNIREESTDSIIYLVKRLVASQFPQWADLTVRPVAHQGNDNRTFRLGEYMSVRLPSAERYVAGVEKEHTWLPRLAPHLPLAIPEPIALGAPGEGYSWPWSIYRWLDGETASSKLVADLAQFALSLAEFLRALYRIDPAGGPAAGLHSFFRGTALSVYDQQTRQAITTLGESIDVDGATRVWEAALASDWHGQPVWFHGDVAITNLLVANGRLSGVIDFGASGVGDPACDLTIAWTFLDEASREILRSILKPDRGTWARGRGWAIWKALTVLAQHGSRADGRKTIWTHNPATGRLIIDEAIAEYRISSNHE